MVNDEEWIFDNDDGQSASAYRGNTPANTKIEVWFRRQGKSSATVVLVYSELDAGGKRVCSLGQRYTGTYVK
jgi:hypothetical protein